MQRCSNVRHTFEYAECGGNKSLHICRAATEKTSLALGQRIRVGRPTRTGGNDICVGSQQQTARRVGAEGCQQVCPAGRAVDKSWAAAQLLHPVRNPALQLVIGRAALGRETNQRCQESFGGRHISRIGEAGKTNVLYVHPDIHLFCEISSKRFALSGGRLG